jgi:hypothetical protein
MGWVPSNSSYVYAWYVHAYLGTYQAMHVYTCISWYVPRYVCMYRHILVCTCHIHVCTILPNHVQVVRIPDDLRICRRPHSSFSDNDCGPPGAVGAWAPPPLPPGPQDLPRDSDYGPDGAAGGLRRSTPRRADDTTTRPSGAGRRVSPMSGTRSQTACYVRRGTGRVVHSSCLILAHSVLERRSLAEYRLETKLV